jgi:hypothetical protein
MFFMSAIFLASISALAFSSACWGAVCGAGAGAGAGAGGVGAGLRCGAQADAVMIVNSKVNTKNSTTHFLLISCISSLLIILFDVFFSFRKEQQIM